MFMGNIHFNTKMFVLYYKCSNALCVSEIFPFVQIVWPVKYNLCFFHELLHLKHVSQLWCSAVCCPKWCPLWSDCRNWWFWKYSGISLHFSVILPHTSWSTVEYAKALCPAVLAIFRSYSWLTSQLVSSFFLIQVMITFVLVYWHLYNLFPSVWTWLHWCKKLKCC